MLYGLAIALGLGAQVTPVTVEIPLSQVGPAAFIRSVKAFPGMGQLKLASVAGKYSVRASGPRNQAATLVEIAQYYDVAPVIVNVNLTYVDLRERTSMAGKISVPNNSEATLRTDPGLELSVLPRVHGDGTISLRLTIKTVEGAPTVIFRLKNKETAIIRAAVDGKHQALSVKVGDEIAHELQDAQFQVTVSAEYDSAHRMGAIQ